MVAREKRKYALVKVKAGDYLLPSNDGKTIWRILRYTEGPSSGLDWPRDRDVWGVWKWLSDRDLVDPDDWDNWDLWDGMHETRAEAIVAALWYVES